jgi:hypothetical protein
MVDEEYNEIISSLRLAKYCIHILNNESDLLHFEGETKTIPVKFVTDETGKRVTVEVENEDEADVYRLDNSDSRYVYDGPRVNKRNAHRFIEKDFSENENMVHVLYMAKCRHLYYLIREKYTDLWWD